MVEEKDVLLDASDVRSSQRRLMILQLRIHVTHETRHFRSHAVLHGEGGVRQIVVDESLKEREVQLVVTAQFVHSGGRPQLLVVADQDQVLALLVQGRHHVGFQHLQTQITTPADTTPADKITTPADTITTPADTITTPADTVIHLKSQHLQIQSQHLQTQS